MLLLAATERMEATARVLERHLTWALDAPPLCTTCCGRAAAAVAVAGSESRAAAASLLRGFGEAELEFGDAEHARGGGGGRRTAAAAAAIAAASSAATCAMRAQPTHGLTGD